MIRHNDSIQLTNHPIAIDNASVDVIRIRGQHLGYGCQCSRLPAAPLACEQHVGRCAWVTDAFEHHKEAVVGAIQRNAEEV